MNLTHDQLAAIDWQLRHKHLLHNEELIAELTDHFAIAISEQMAIGQSFDEAGETVMSIFGGWDGIVQLQKEFVNAQNRAAWTTFGRVALSYLTIPRLLLTLLLLSGTYYLLQTYWKLAFYGLGLLHIALYIIVGYGPNAMNSQTWSWKDVAKSINSMLDNRVSAIRNSQAGMLWVVSIVTVVAFNVPIFLYLFFFPFTFDRLFDVAFPAYATIGYVSSYISFFCIGELTYQHNSFLNRFSR